MGSHVLVSANTQFARTFIYSETFYSIFERGNRSFVLGERPTELVDADTIDQKILKKHRAYLARLERFPFDKADYYTQLRESTGISSVRGLSEVTREDWSYIAKVLKILELPEAIREYLRNHKEPEILRHFHLRRIE